MHGTITIQAADYARFREAAPGLNLSEITATIVVEDCETPFGLINGEVDIEGEGDGWFITDVRIADEVVNGKVKRWFSLGDRTPSYDSASPLRFMHAAMVAKVDDDTAIDALLQKVG